MTSTDCPDLSHWATEATRRNTDPDSIGADVLTAIRTAIEDHPRSKQREIGPSEIGHPCNRWLAYRLAGVHPTGLQKAPWRQAVGTAVHDHFDLWLDHANQTTTRWLFNLRVMVGELYPGRPITGRLDALDLHTATVIDLKVPGPNGMKLYSPNKPESPQYDVQLDLYGQGACNAGFPISTVGILRVPAAGELDTATWRPRPHNPRRAHNALARAGGIARMVDTLGSKAIPLQPATEHHCSRCDWFKPNTTDLTVGCPGADTFIASRDARPDPITQLIA